MNCINKLQAVYLFSPITLIRLRSGLFAATADKKVWLNSLLPAAKQRAQSCTA